MESFLDCYYLVIKCMYITDKMIVNDMLKGVPLLILANKQDLEVGIYKYIKN